MAQPRRTPSRDPEDDHDDGGPQDPPAKSFAVFIQDQRAGALHNELSEALAEVVQRVIDLNKAGSLALSIKVSPAGKGQAAVFITDEVKSKPPEDKQSFMYFSDGHGNISRSNPNQPELPLREVPAPEPRDLPPRS
jgi:hypothetical protein